MIGRQGFLDFVNVHDDEGDAIGEGPGFVGPGGKERDATLEQVVAGFNDRKSFFFP